MECLIVVEGKDDKRFLEDYISFLNLEVNPEIVLLNGNYKRLDQGLLDVLFRKQYANILFITDSDVGFEDQKTIINQYLKQFDLEPKIFLFPTDDATTIGNLESLLTNLAKIQEFFNCFDPMLDCLLKNKAQMKVQNQGKINLPDHHGKMYMYTSLFVKEARNANGSKRDYLIENIWDLDHAALNPLKEFLQNNLSE